MARIYKKKVDIATSYNGTHTHTIGNVTTHEMQMTVLLFRHMGWTTSLLFFSIFYTSKSIEEIILDWTGKSRNGRSKVCVQCYFVTLTVMTSTMKTLFETHTKNSVKIKIRHYRDCVFSVFDDIVYRTKTLASNNKKHVFCPKLINRYFRQEMTTAVPVRLAWRSAVDSLNDFGKFSTDQTNHICVRNWMDY